MMASKTRWGVSRQVIFPIVFFQIGNLRKIRFDMRQIELTVSDVGEQRLFHSVRLDFATLSTVVQGTFFPS